MSDRGLPRSYRLMEGFGIHTSRLVNEQGASSLVKFRWKPKAGVHSLLWEEAQLIAGTDPDFHRRDLTEAIASGAFPQWELGIQSSPTPRSRPSRAWTRWTPPSSSPRISRRYSRGEDGRYRSGISYRAPSDSRWLHASSTGCECPYMGREQELARGGFNVVIMGYVLVALLGGCRVPRREADRRGTNPSRTTLVMNTVDNRYGQVFDY